MAAVGRSKLIPREVEEAILAHRANGLSFDAIACVVPGVSRATAYRVVTQAAERAARRAQIEGRTCPCCGQPRPLPKTPIS